MFNVLLKNNTKRHLGSILLVEYILFDVLRIFFLFLSGTGILNCLPPLFTTQDIEHLLKNIMKAFLATWIGGPFLKFCSESHGEAIIKMTKDASDGSINNNRDLPVTAKVRTCGLDNLALSGEWRFQLFKWRINWIVKGDFEEVSISPLQNAAVVLSLFWLPCTNFMLNLKYHIR